MKIIAIANHKGGVGKTTTTHSLGDALSMSGYRVLLVDLDPQSTLTNACGVTDANPNLTEVFSNKVSITAVIYDVSHHEGTLHLLASDIQMALVEKSLPAQLDGYYIMKKELPKLAGHYDVCLVDCPPSLSALVYNGLIASQAVIIPTLPQINDLRGLNLFLDTVIEMQSSDHLNPKLIVLGILPTMYDDRLLTHREALEILTNNFKPFETKISRSIRVAESPTIGQSILVYEPNSKPAKQYRELAKEIEKWLNGSA